MFPISPLHGNSAFYALQHELITITEKIQEITTNILYYPKDRKDVGEIEAIIAEKQKSGLALLEQLLNTLDQPYRGTPGIAIVNRTNSHRGFLEQLIRELESVKDGTLMSPEYLEVLQLKGILEALKEFRFGENRYNKENRQFILGGLSTFLSTAQFGQTLMSSSADIIVVSIGSASEVDLQQQSPKFAHALGISNRVDVINIDPNMGYNGFRDAVSSKSVHVYGFEGAVDSTRGGLPAFLKLNKMVEGALEHILSNTDIRVVLLYNESPQLSGLVCNLGQKFVNKIGSQLEIIGNYFTDCPTPAVLYSPEVFKKKDMKAIHEAIVPVWRHWSGLEAGAKKAAGVPLFSEPVFQGWKTEALALGELFPSLEQISATDLFKNRPAATLRFDGKTDADDRAAAAAEDPKKPGASPTFPFKV